jgi:hypothetical protein
MAETLELSPAAFTRCLDSGEKWALVEQSLEDGIAQGIDSTPPLFVNGTAIPEWHDWTAVMHAIDGALASAATPYPWHLDAVAGCGVTAGIPAGA